MASREPVIRVRGVTRSFGAHVALRPIDLEIAPGDVVGLLGPNGSGKSTLLRILVGLVAPHGGTAEVAGVPLRGDGTAIRKRCTYAPGEIGMYREMSAGEHLRWLLRGRGRRALERARSLADELGLPWRQRVHGYSHGMKRQLLFVAAMAPEVPVRILDEPTEGLDPSKRRAVLDVLGREAAAGATILLSSHHLGEVESACNRLLFLERGRLLADEAPDVLREKARRILRITFAEETSAEDVRGAIERAGAGLLDGEPVYEGDEAHLFLTDTDPRPFLRALLADAAAPQPRAIDYGRPSLRDLYRQIYGVEGL